MTGRTVLALTANQLLRDRRCAPRRVNDQPHTNESSSSASPIPAGRNDWYMTSGATRSQVLKALGDLGRRMDSRDIDAG
jgi:lysophospholipase L1-like esterase